ncbi:MAG TPA: hypothetical protein VFA32_04345, partial [Dehalococcoidia bacterium]|nr:hypothetical protein [Dehalococcoidia bacterium]
MGTLAEVILHIGYLFDSRRHSPAVPRPSVSDDSLGPSAPVFSEFSRRSKARRYARTAAGEADQSRYASAPNINALTIS